eukprot:404771_1
MFCGIKTCLFRQEVETFFILIVLLPPQLIHVMPHINLYAPPGKSLTVFNTVLFFVCMFFVCMFSVDPCENVNSFKSKSNRMNNVDDDLEDFVAHRKLLPSLSICNGNLQLCRNE